MGANAGRLLFPWLEDSLCPDGPVLGMSAIALMAAIHSPGFEGFD